jgi:hypothetical protein
MQIGAGLTASSNATGEFSTRPAPDDTRLSNQSQWLVLPPGASTRPGAPQHTLFRTTFSLPVGAKPGVGRARIAAALVGCGHVSLNGHRLGVDVLGSVSQLDKTVLCVGHTFTALFYVVLNFVKACFVFFNRRISFHFIMDVHVLR